MDKYTLLIILNLPFVIFGIINALLRYKENTLDRLTLITKLVFWASIGTGIIFAEEMYNALVQKNLTNSPPLSLADVILVTGVSFCFFLSLRVYSRLEETDRKLSDLQEKLSVRLSDKK